MKIKLYFFLTLITPMMHARNVYWYNATDKTIILNEHGRPRTHNSIEPKELFSYSPGWFPSTNYRYWFSDQPKAEDIYFKVQYARLKPEDDYDIVNIFETTNNKITVRAVAKTQFDEEYAKAMKETQKKYVPKIQEATPLPPPLCGIVSGYLVDKPE